MSDVHKQLRREARTGRVCALRAGHLLVCRGRDRGGSEPDGPSPRSLRLHTILRPRPDPQEPRQPHRPPPSRSFCPTQVHGEAGAGGPFSRRRWLHAGVAGEWADLLAWSGHLASREQERASHLLGTGAPFPCLQNGTLILPHWLVENTGAGARLQVNAPGRGSLRRVSPSERPG